MLKIYWGHTRYDSRQPEAMFNAKGFCARSLKPEGHQRVGVVLLYVGGIPHRDDSGSTHSTNVLPQRDMNMIYLEAACFEPIASHT